ncbi:hypothetical protein [Acidithiobacillus sp.]|nr:hypothetical protein [Acidithiobacillus sp.]
MRVKRISLDTNILDDKMKRFLTGANGFALWLFIRQNTVYGILP